MINLYFTQHAKQRIDERSKASLEDFIHYCESPIVFYQYTALDKTEQDQYWLIWSKKDNDAFIAVVNYLNGAVKTIIPAWTNNRPTRMRGLRNIDPSLCIEGNDDDFQPLSEFDSVTFCFRDLINLFDKLGFRSVGDYADRFKKPTSLPSTYDCKLVLSAIVGDGYKNIVIWRGFESELNEELINNYRIEASKLADELCASSASFRLVPKKMGLPPILDERLN